MTKDELGIELQQRLSLELPGFNLDEILAVIQAILDTLGVCKNQGTSASGVKEQARVGIFGRLSLRRHLRNEGFRPGSDEHLAAMKAILKIADISSSQEVGEFLTECVE